MNTDQESKSADRPEEAVVAVVRRNSRWLTIQRSEHVRAPGMLCFPGGGILPGESADLAVNRELREELGVVPADKQLIWQSHSAWGVQLWWWQVTLKESAEFTPNPHEVAGLHWMTTDEILAHAALLSSNREFFAEWAGGRFNQYFAD